jgi:raffinose/stachyose/melibiose transport system permease protein
MQKIQKAKKGDTSERIFYALLVALPVLQVLIFYFFVNFNSVLMSFKTYDTLENEFTWDFGANFSKLWYELTETSIIRDAFKNSLIVWFFTTVVGTFLAIVFAYYIYKKWTLAKTFKFFLFLPSVLPSILLVIVFKFFANEAIPGYIEVFMDKQIEGLFIGKDTLMPTVIFYNVWICFGSQLLIYTGAMDQIAPEIIEAGKVDGVSTVREFFSIVVPMILPTVSTFVVANVATLFTNQANLYAFFGEKVDYANQTLGYYLFVLVNKTGNGKTMYTYASALGIVCTLIAFPLTMLARKLLNAVGDE